MTIYDYILYLFNNLIVNTTYWFCNTLCYLRREFGLCETFK